MISHGQIGKRNRRITFRQIGGSLDSMNEIDKTSITTIATRWAQVKVESGIQEKTSDKIIYEGTVYEFTTNYTSTLEDLTLKINYRSKDYDIISIDNVESMDTTLVYRAVQRK